MPGQTGLTVAYVGSRGIHLYGVGDGNYIPPDGSSNGMPTWSKANLPRLNPNFGGWYQIGSRADSWYNSLQLTVTKRVTHGLQFQSSYTYAKVLDTLGGVLTSEALYNGALFGVFPENPKRFDKGPSQFDVQQNWRFNMTYRLPDIPSDNPAAKALHGWWMGSIVAAQTGLPFTPVIQASRSLESIFANAAGVDRPNVAATYDPSKVIVGKPNEWFDPTMFSLQPMGILGNAGRNSLRGPGLVDWDFSINKDTKLPHLGEDGKLQFRAELFNILNHTNFGMPANTVFNGSATDKGTPLGNAGVITNTATSSRQIQLALKLIF